MWLGLLYLTAADDPDADGATVLVCAWEAGRERPLTSAGPREAVSDIVRMVREAASSGTSLVAPQCDACGTPLELPFG
jgi:hypothetical protein